MTTSERPDSHATTDRQVMTGEAYGSDAHLVARQKLYHFQHPRYNLPAMITEYLARVTGVVLDAGCGNGWYLRHLRSGRPDLTTLGLDISSGILSGLDPPLMVADAQRLPLADGSVNAVLAMHMLYHLPDPATGLREFARVLTQNGILIVSTNGCSDKIELDRLWSRAAAEVLGIAEGPSRVSLSSSFPLENASDQLAERFDEVCIVELLGTITVTEPAPVVAHFASYRPWAASSGVPFDETLARAGRLLADHISQHGSFTVTCRSGILTASNGGVRSSTAICPAQFGPARLRHR